MLGKRVVQSAAPAFVGRHLNLREHLTIGEPRAILQLVADFADGTSQTIVTDETWKAGTGPILRKQRLPG